MFSALGSRRERCSSPSPAKLRHLSKISEVTEQSSNEKSSELNWNNEEKRQSWERDEQIIPAVSELSNTGICEMEAVYVSEMDADWQFSQELPNSEVSGARNEPTRSSLLRSKPSATWSFMCTSPASRPVSPRTSRVSQSIMRAI